MFAFAAAQAPPPRDREGAGERPAPASLAAAIADLVPGSDAGSLVFVLSDFWDPGAAVPLAALASTPGMVAALHILSAAERDPASLGRGVIRLVDAETGQERDMTLDEDMLTRYRAALGRHTDALAGALTGWNLLLPVAAEERLTDVCLERLPVTGMIA